MNQPEGSNDGSGRVYLLHKLMRETDYMGLIMHCDIAFFNQNIVQYKLIGAISTQGTVYCEY